MHRSLILFLFLMLLPDIAHGLAWNREAKGYYLLSQTLLPSSYTSEAGVASIKSVQEAYKIYLEYGITPRWMLIAEVASTNLHDRITVNATQPYRWKTANSLPYQQYNGRIGLSYQIAKESNRALSMQIFYKPGDFLYRKGNQDYQKSSEEISLGITKGMSANLGKMTDMYLEMGYMPSLYYRERVYSPESRLNLGLNFQRFTFEVGMWNKINASNIKIAPYNITPEDMPHHFGYVATDINSLIKIKNHHDLTTFHFKFGYQISKTKGVELGVYKHSKGEGDIARMVYSVGYVIKG